MKLDWVKTQQDWVNSYESQIKMLLVSIDYIGTKTKQCVEHMRILFDQEKVRSDHIDRDTILDSIETWHEFFSKQMEFIRTFKDHYQTLVLNLTRVELAVLTKNLAQLESQGREFFDAPEVTHRVAEIHKLYPHVREGNSQTKLAARTWQRDPKEDEEDVECITTPNHQDEEE